MNASNQFIPVSRFAQPGRCGSLLCIALAATLCLGTAQFVSGATVLSHAPNAAVYLGLPLASLEFENPLASTVMVLSHKVLDWRDADYSDGPPPWYDDWSVSAPLPSTGGTPDMIFLLQQDAYASTTTTVPSTVVSIHLHGDANDGSGKVLVDGNEVARLNMNSVPSDTALIVVSGLANTTHTVEVYDLGGPQFDDVHILGAAALKESDLKWDQPPLAAHPENLFYGWNQPSMENMPPIAADDWVCTSTNPITNIRWWGSFLGWQEPYPPQLPAAFQIRFWSDVPKGADPMFPDFSHPGALAAQPIYCTSYTWTFAGWDYDPRTGHYETCFLFEQTLATNEWFYQQPNATGTNIYWLSIETLMLNSTNIWGWKTRPRDPASPAPDDAVMFDPNAPPAGFYAPLWWPDPMHSWDLAFELISEYATTDAKWFQPPDLRMSPVGFPLGMDVNASYIPSGMTNLLADDFLCTEPGPITNITIWSSWWHDQFPNQPPNNVTITLSIHQDYPIPNAYGYSMPGLKLWTRTFSPGSFICTQVSTNVFEGWFTPPNQAGYEPSGDATCFRYDFTIPAAQAFTQQGNGTVYWLDVQAQVAGTGNYRFGWKTSSNHWNDDACHMNAREPFDGPQGVPPKPWNKLTYPPGHPFYPDNVDLAFRLNYRQYNVSEVKWSQPPVLFTPPDGFNGWNQYSVEGQQFVADDWGCTNLTPVTDIHWWGSFIGWSMPGLPEQLGPTLPAGFQIVIWDDVPKGPNTLFSHPGNIVWQTYCTNFTWEFAGWDFDPRNPAAAPEACFKYSQDLRPEEWFTQDPKRGTNIYWISIAAVYPAGQVTQYPWGWKTRLRDPNSLAPDDAVVSNPLVFPPWQPIEYPAGTSWDMAFELTTVKVLTPTNDFGDAPSPYPTLLASNGARHTVVPGIFLGNLIDAELDGQPNATATGDDLNNLADEDGVGAPWGLGLVPGEVATVTVTASTNGYLSAWVDFNVDGSWAEAGDQIFTNVLLSPGPSNLIFNVPFSAARGTNTFARFRFSTVNIASITGQAPDGEVEDYRWHIEELDFGDAPEPTFPTKHAANGARHVLAPTIFLGALIDSEFDGQPNATATGDDITKLADEDGVTLLTPLIAGQPASVRVVTTMLGGLVNAPLNAWIDFGGDGSWTTPGDQICINAGMIPGINIVTFNVPANAAAGSNVFARFRFSTMPSPALGFAGIAPNGEVEDYCWPIYPPYDYGDAPSPYPTLLANDGARHKVVTNVYLGRLIDIETNGLPNATATGDDINNLADEEGVVLFGSHMIPGGQSGVAVTASVNGYLSAWVDFNIDGSWATPGDQIFTNVWITNGLNNLYFNVPFAIPRATNTFARFRFSTQPITNFTGFAVDGEVEDYRWWIEELDFGDAPPPFPTLYANNGAYHWLLPNVFLGNIVDSEFDGQPNATATGDDIAKLADEDGVRLLTPLLPGQMASVQVVASIAGAWLNAWVDFGADGSWATPGDQILVNASPAAGTNFYNFLVPANAAGGSNVFARFRFSTMQGLSYTNVPGNVPNGEVEDHRWYVDQLDYGDAPDGAAAPGYPTLLVNNGARHILSSLFLGTKIDAELDGQPNASATGDDLAGVDDEDGVSFPTALIGGNYTTIQVVSSGGGYLQGWFDWNRDGDWADAGEQVIVNRPVVAGTNNITFVVPNGVVAGNSYARFRLSTVTNLSFTGLAPDGEVEDYQVRFLPLKWVQHPEIGLYGVDVFDGIPLADDFRCTQSGPITDIHIWGSYTNDVFPKGGPGNMNVTLTIYRDIPVGPYGHSQPGQAFWTRTFGPGQFTASRSSPSDGEWWHNPVPVPPVWRPNADTNIIQFDFYIGASNAFQQVSNTVYWLGVQYTPVTGDINYSFGWKTTWETFNDAACWYDAANARWRPLLYGDGHPGSQYPPPLNWMHLAFALSTQDLDWGDAPAPYPTLAASNGAAHVIVPGLMLGNVIDKEADGQPDPAAMGDDNNPPAGPDDEDGVILPVLTPGQPGSVSVTVNGSGLLSAWIDFAKDGSWAEPGDQILANVPVNTGVYILPFLVPSNALWGATTFGRFRLSTASNLSYTGLAPDGEVEDHVVNIHPLPHPDLGDAPDSSNGWGTNMTAYPTGTNANYPTVFSGPPPFGPLHWNPGLAFLGNTVSGELDADNGPDQDFINNLLPAANLANLDGGDDGLIGPVILPHCGMGSINVQVTMLAAPGPMLLNVWCDWNRDGDWNDTMTCPDGTQAPEWAVQNFVVPPAGGVFPLAIKSWHRFLQKEPIWIRITLAEQRWPAPGGGVAGGDGPQNGYQLGETEDYYLTDYDDQQTFDFGDAPDGVTAPGFPTLLVNNGARHTIVPGVFLGANIDAELDGQPNANATGDDINGGPDDEDGVAFVGTLIPGQPYTIQVTASIAGFLNAWVDFNADRSWAQPTDQIFNNQPLAAGVTALTFTVPNNAAWSTNVFARFRFTTSTNNLGYVGLAPNGEVEDYMMTMEPFPQHDLGDAPASLNNFGLVMTAYPPGGPPGVVANFPTALVFPGPLAPVGPIHMSPTNVAFLGNNVTFESNADIGSDQDLVNNILPATDQPDKDGADDGVLFPLILPHCRNTVINYTVTFRAPPPPGTSLYVNVWFDWNRDGDWNDMLQCPDGNPAPEWAVQNQLLPVVLGPYPVVITNVSLPFRSWHPSLTNQPIWMRITLAEQLWPPLGGAMPFGGEGPLNGYALGETEDYYVRAYDDQQTFDFSDAPSPYPTVLPNGARHLIVPGFNLGALIDAETNGLPHPQALGDDLNNLADEDGVTFATPLVAGTQACVNVTLASGPLGGRLDAWLDFNKNGVWGDIPAERIFVNQALVPGINAGLCFSVPTNAPLGTNFSRFRLSSAGSLGPSGAAQDGEVEDYQVVVRQRALTTNITITAITATNVSPNQVVTIRWNAQTNVHYEVLAATNISTNITWTVISPEIIGPSNQWTETNAWTLQRYYRVRAPWVWP